MKKLFLLMIMLTVFTACGSGKEEPKQTASPVVEDKEAGKAYWGKWTGDIMIPQSPLSVILELEEAKGSLSVPAQGLAGFPFKSVSYAEGKVSIAIDMNGSAIQIDGELQKGVIKAVFKQNGGAFPLTLTPYEEEPITYEPIVVPVTGGSLHAALQLPEAAGDAKAGAQEVYPVAIIIAGSGPTDKDGNTIGAGKNNSLRLLAETLADQGIASIRYDKRGIGENSSLAGQEADLRFEHYVEDVKHLATYVASRPELGSLYIIGHSEGSLIGMLAAQQKEVAGFVSLAGPGRAADVVLAEQLQAQLSGDLLEQANTALKQLKAGELLQEVPKELQSLFRPSVQPYMISWFKYDPAAELKKLADKELPVLIVQGTHDLQVSGADAELLSKSYKAADLYYVEGMNHVLKDAPAERAVNLATYTNPALPLADGLVDRIKEFILR